MNEVHLSNIDPHRKQLVLQAIRGKLNLLGHSIADAIRVRNLYLRISLTGHCNLNCCFCHNEGAPRVGYQDLPFTVPLLHEAYRLGFRRVQFTGGEPLLHPQVRSFIREASTIFPGVGITTNGVYLHRCLNDILIAGVSNIHISMEPKHITSAGPLTCPELKTIASRLVQTNSVSLRLNLPIKLDELAILTEAIGILREYQCDIHILVLITSETLRSIQALDSNLHKIVDRENYFRKAKGQLGQITLRGYRPPAGVRCSFCKSFERCREHSRSLRLGADKVLRPCLASRDWDICLDSGDLAQQLEEATMFSIDYMW